MRARTANVVRQMALASTVLCVFLFTQSCQLKPTDTLTVTAFEGGTSSPSGVVSVKEGAETTIQAIPTSGFSFVCWIVQSGTAQLQSATAASTTVSLTSGDANVMAMFAHSGSSIPSGYIANYPFDGNAVDASGDGLNGTVYGATAVTDRFGNANGALFFSGSNSYVQTIPSSSIPASLSVGLWVRPTALNRQVWGSIYDPSGGKNGWVTWLGGDGSISFQRYYNNAASNSITSPTGEVALNQWSYLVFTFDGSTGNAAIYVNATQVASGVLSILTNGNDTPLTFGISALLQSYYFYSGSMDGVRVYNRALTSSEVYDLYTNGG